MDSHISHISLFFEMQSISRALGPNISKTVASKSNQCSQHSMLFNVMLCYTMFFYAVLCSSAMLFCALPFYSMSFYAILCYMMSLCHLMMFYVSLLFYSMTCYFILCCATSCKVVLVVLCDSADLVKFQLTL